MAEGKIKKLLAGKDFGFIEPDGGGKDVFFHFSWLREIAVQEGLRVQFDVEQGEKGPRARNLKILGASDDSSLDLAADGDAKAYRFLNPYNFVRNLTKPRPADHVLGDCPPPPHDRYVGLTGRMTCNVEAVTSLFVSDSHGINKKVVDGKEHYSYRFFEYGGKPALPASSLRGMIRSVFEAVTNSCFGVFDGHKRLEFREGSEYGRKVKSNACIVCRLAQPATESHPAIDGEIKLCHVGKIPAYYESSEAWKNLLGHKLSGDPWQCGDRVVARAKKRKHDWLVCEIAETQQALQRLQKEEEYVEGWLKITGKGEDTNKRSEALFLDPDLHERKDNVAFSYEVQRDFNFVLANQIHEEDLPISPQSNALGVGNLVWVDVTGGKNRLYARRIVRVQVPRVPYRQTVGNLLQNGHLHHCVNYDDLCPACRVFGWVHERPSKEMEHTAYAGRLGFGHANLTNTPSLYKEEIPFAILSTPKPTTTCFYLLDRDGKPSATVTYDTDDAQLRGRKFYRHHGEARPKEYKRAEKDHQNRTVRNALKSGAAFTFRVQFENLAPLELGALLYAVELEDQMVHRLGYAKPLGFGSVKVTVETVEIVNWKKRITAP
jgi:CRISPR-associated protein (TIGR03986 family)